jgi:pimeloyl-ACP methyl ester carboxylesterase
VRQAIIEQMPADTAGTADASAEEAAPVRALVLGHSLGGYVGMVLASRYPDLVSGLVVSGACCDYGGRGSLFLRLLGVLYRSLSDQSLANLVPQGYPDVQAATMRECITSCGMFYDAWPGIVRVLTAIVCACVLGALRSDLMNVVDLRVMRRYCVRFEHLCC